MHAKASNEASLMSNSSPPSSSWNLRLPSRGVAMAGHATCLPRCLTLPLDGPWYYSPQMNDNPAAPVHSVYGRSRGRGMEGGGRVPGTELQNAPFPPSGACCTLAAWLKAAATNAILLQRSCHKIVRVQSAHVALLMLASGATSSGYTAG